MIGGLVTVHAEPLFVDGEKLSVIVNAFVDVPENDCALFPVPVISICVPAAVADNAVSYTHLTLPTKRIV